MNMARFNGGPLDGQSFVTPEGVWPLADEFTLALVSLDGEFGVGRYRKTNESQLSDEQVDHPNLARGAEYAYVDEPRFGDGEATAVEPVAAWNEATGEGVDMSRPLPAPETIYIPGPAMIVGPDDPEHPVQQVLRERTSKPAPADWDPRTDYPERFTEGPI